MKQVLSVATAIVVSIIFVFIILFAFRLGFQFVNFFRSIMILGLVAVFAVPLYIIISKKLFK